MVGAAVVSGASVVGASDVPGASVVGAAVVSDPPVVVGRFSPSQAATATTRMMARASAALFMVTYLTGYGEHRIIGEQP